MPGALTSSYFSTGNDMYVSRDRHTTFAELYPRGPIRLDVLSGAEKMRAAAARGLPAGITVNVTGRDALGEASTHGSGGGSGVLLEALIGGVGALVILLFVFGTLPAVLADPDCGLVTVRVERDGNAIVWRDLADTGVGDVDGTWDHFREDYADLRAFRFDAAAYESCIAQLARNPPAGR